MKLFGGSGEHNGRSDRQTKKRPAAAQSGAKAQTAPKPQGKKGGRTAVPKKHSKKRIAAIVIAVLIAYLVVRRSSALNNTIDTLSMLPYIMPGAVIGLALLIAFGKKPFALTGTMTIMIIALVIRRLPYTIRSATATLMQISMSIEEAAISLGASKAKTFVKITVPMMANGIFSGAILSWVAIVTELSSSIILYNQKSITLTMSTYVAISRGNYGLAAAFAAILTLITTISLLIYLAVTKSEDVRL